MSNLSFQNISFCAGLRYPVRYIMAMLASMLSEVMVDCFSLDPPFLRQYSFDFTVMESTKSGVRNWRRKSYTG